MKKPAGTAGKHLGLGAGGAVENSFQNTPLTLANPIYNIGLGVSPVLIGFTMAVPRIWELFIDPVIGTVSDRTKSRLGRRLPYMLASLLASFLLFVLMWWAPAGMSKNGLGIWLIVTAFLFYTAYSFFAIPYAALTIEASEAGPDRIGVMTARTAFANLSLIAINWIYWFCQRDWFSSPVEGMKWVSIGFGLIVFLCGLTVVGTAVKRGLHRRPVHEGSAPVEKGNYRKILRLRPTRCILAALLSTMVGFTLVGHLGFYLLAFHACRGNLKQAALVGAVKATVTLIAAVLSCPLIGAAAKRFGKDRVFNVLLFAGALSSLSMWYLITPANPYLSVISDLGIALCLVGFWTLMPAYLGDISDYYEKTTGQSCQGALSALYGIAVKIGASLALLLTGYVLVVCGFHADMPFEAMARPVFNMRILFAVVPSLGLAVSFAAMSQFRFAHETKRSRMNPPLEPQ
jgi:GPH family glycoside/pentoside/hexuronide:cation symporter